MDDFGPLTCLLGQRVTKAVMVHDYVHLSFGDAVQLSIFNDFEVEPEKSGIADLIGLRVTAVHSSAKEELIKLEDGLRLRIELGSEAFHGPEAMRLGRAGHDTVVWN